MEPDRESMPAGAVHVDHPKGGSIVNAARVEYLGYVGIAKFDDAAKVWHGRVQDIRDVVTFQADDESLLGQELQGSIDDYLEFCRSLGKAPNPPKVAE